MTDTKLAKLDLTKPYATVYGSTNGIKYDQNNKHFNARGEEVILDTPIPEIPLIPDTPLIVNKRSEHMKAINARKAAKKAGAV